jgi:hypothetical protein
MRRFADPLSTPNGTLSTPKEPYRSHPPYPSYTGKSGSS